FLSTPKQEEIPMLFGLCFFLVFVVLQQVDDLRKVYVEKQHAINLSESKTRFLASMSHEIRTPINAILGMNEMILRENHDEVTLDYARSIKSSGKMLLMLVNDVLDFSKIEAGKLEITESRYDLSEVLYDVISLIGERSNEKGLTLKTEFTAPVPVGQISDEFRIRQILINLMNNAVKYTDSGSVTLKVGGKNIGDDGYELYFSVEDTGRGIRVEDQEELFEAFSRADMGKNVNIEGTGLGLAIVKSIVDSMHGNIEVESEYGKGSAFRVRIPVRVADPSPVPQDFMEKRKVDVVSEEECDFLAPDAKVLAVDDNRSNLTIVKLFLKRTGIVPDLCDNGKSALAKCREKKYDLILLDHMMPSPDGIETLQLIREDRDSKNKETAAVVLTANAVAGSRQIYMDAGFSDYLTKPLDFKVLEQTVKRYLPEDKVQSREDEESKRNEDDGFFAEFLPHEESGVYGGTQGKGFEEKLSRIERLDYRTAIGHSAGDEEVLAAVLADIAAEGAERCSRMRDNVSGRRWKEYGIDAHAVKGLMATIGMKDLSEKAKQQEFAAKEEDSEVILAGAEAFIGEYESLCRRLEELV
nr:response regulator [Lachnospiraceae bacterium]